MGDDRLFELPPAQPVQPEIDQQVYPLWTERKAALVGEYLRLFLMITKHGIYIDGFAGPQQEDHQDLWTAREVLGLEPDWLRHFYLFERDQEKLKLLHELRAQNPERDVRVFDGDFNRRVDEILTEEHIGPNEATFCLLDQHTFECEWETVRRLAEYKDGGYKIEQFYFLAQGWLDRALSGVSRPDTETELQRWWGGPDWGRLEGKPAWPRARELAQRFRSELGYSFVVPWPIYANEKGGRIMYFMIHASDHPDAPRLMERAHRAAAAPIQHADQLSAFDTGPFREGAEHATDSSTNSHEPAGNEPASTLGLDDDDG